MEDFQTNSPVVIQDNSDELEIDWLGIFSRLLKHWKQIFLISFIFGVIGIVSALTMTRQYNVTMTLAPEVTNRANNNLSSITSMLGLNGVSLNPGTDAMSITLFPEICQSTPFLAALLDVPLTSYVSEKQHQRAGSGRCVFRSEEKMRQEPGVSRQTYCIWHLFKEWL